MCRDRRPSSRGPPLADGTRLGLDPLNDGATRATDPSAATTARRRQRAPPDLGQPGPTGNLTMAKIDWLIKVRCCVAAAWSIVAPVVSAWRKGGVASGYGLRLSFVALAATIALRWAPRPVLGETVAVYYAVGSRRCGRLAQRVFVRPSPSRSSATSQPTSLRRCPGRAQPQRAHERRRPRLYCSRAR